MTERRNNHSPLRLTLPSVAVKRLAEAGIHCRPEIGLEYQRSASQYVLRGRESGGATSELGRYVSFCAVDGQRLPWLIRPDSLARNGDHAIVVAPLLVSIEMFRFEHTYELLILRHAIVEAEKGKRPCLLSQIVFRGWQGQLPLDLAGKDKSQAGKIAPEFFDRSGEPRELPSAYVDGVQAVILADSGVKSVKLPPRSPNLNAYAERFVRTIKESCLDRLILFGEDSLRKSIQEFIAHYHRERHHQGLGNRLIIPDSAHCENTGEVQRRERLGGMLNYYYREAA
jgi:hypothetical protein